MNFASDNNAGTHPKILQAIIESNEGYAHAYGDDPWRRKAQELCQSMFGNQSELFHVFVRRKRTSGEMKLGLPNEY